MVVEARWVSHGGSTGARGCPHAMVGGHSHWCLLDFCSVVSWAVPSDSSSAPILAQLDATCNALDLCLHLRFYFFLSCHPAELASLSGAENRVGKMGWLQEWRRAGGLAQDPCVTHPVCLLAGRGLLLGLRRGTIISPSVLLF